MPSLFLRNVSPTPGQWLTLDLRVPAATGTRPAIGATARLVLPNGRIVSGQVDGGSGHSGKRAPEIHFGLGRDFVETDVAVELAWRDGAGVHRRTVHLPLDQRHRIVLDRDTLAQAMPGKS
jgi:hypothetical protein